MVKNISLCVDYYALAEVWIASVKATHDFLSEEDIEFYYKKIPSAYMPRVEIYAIKNDSGEWIAFIGLSSDNVEMLFVHPNEMGKGYGSSLLEFAIKEKGIKKVDVNEQNHKALKFYQKHGFSIVGRDATDGEGMTYPILHLELRDKQVQQTRAIYNT